MTAAAASLATAAGFLSSLRQHSARPLVFEYGGRRVQPGYHVTEVLAAGYRGLDCGANPEAWTETVVQLWDVPGRADQARMTAAKFISIYEKVAARVPLEEGANLVLECGDEAGAAARYTVESVGVEGGAVVVRLEPKRASCKPRDRRLEPLGVTLPALAAGGGGAGPVQTMTPSCCGPAAGQVALEVVALPKRTGCCG